METYEYSFILTKQLPSGAVTKIGVAGSGNLEVIIKPGAESNLTKIEVYTSMPGFKNLWDEVIKRFITDYPFNGLHIELFDSAATPQVVSLRLRQAIETYQTGYHKKARYSEAGARNRIYSLVDEGSFNEFLLDTNTLSPTLPDLCMQGESDDGVVIGTAGFAGAEVAIASQQKDFIGGSVGEIHGAKIIGLVKYAIKHHFLALVFLIDSGGVRLQEANVGEIEISEIIRAILEARSSGIKTIGVVCGTNGAFGGMGIVCGTLDYLIVNQGARIGISGAEVIQAVKGTEVFDSHDRALVWRVYGARTRYLQQAVQAYTNNTMKDIRDCIINALDELKKQPILNLDSVQEEQKRLQQRTANSCDCHEQGQLIARDDPKLAEQDIFDCSDATFLSLAQQRRHS